MRVCHVLRTTHCTPTTPAAWSRHDVTTPMTYRSKHTRHALSHVLQTPTLIQTSSPVPPWGGGGGRTIGGRADESEKPLAVSGRFGPRADGALEVPCPVYGQY
eukprot:scaffold170385_cov36-Tisochrysis_lutea.AAC.2